MWHPVQHPLVQDARADPFYTTREYAAESSKEKDAPATPHGCNGRILKLES